jgi:hypothetical protein
MNNESSQKTRLGLKHKWQEEPVNYNQLWLASLRVNTYRTTFEGLGLGGFRGEKQFSKWTPCALVGCEWKCPKRKRPTCDTRSGWPFNVIPTPFCPKTDARSKITAPCPSPLSSAPLLHLLDRCTHNNRPTTKPKEKLSSSSSSHQTSQQINLAALLTSSPTPHPPKNQPPPPRPRPTNSKILGGSSCTKKLHTTDFAPRIEIKDPHAWPA